jgi:predicted transposase YdaD
MADQSLIDRSIKILFQRAPLAFFRLAGVDAPPESVRAGDVQINIPEHRADQLFLVGDEGDPDRWGWHVEYQLAPDRRALPGWLLKNAAFNSQLGFPVVLTVVYLHRGRRSQFPDEIVIRAGALENRFAFHTIRLWEHAERIRSGELVELAPLLVLCEDDPGEEVLRTERDLILRANVEDRTRSDLLGVAISVAARYFSRDLLFHLFREELAMLKEASFIEEWIAEGIAKGEQLGLQRGLERGMQQGLEQGMLRGQELGQELESRRVLLKLLRHRFGELPAKVITRVERADRGWCEAMLDPALDARKLDDLDFS